jgi:hypothetical protein
LDDRGTKEHQARQIMEALRPWPWQVDEAINSLQKEIKGLKNRYQKKFNRPQNRITSLISQAHVLQLALNDIHRLIDAECRSLGHAPAGLPSITPQQTPIRPANRDRAGLFTVRNNPDRRRTSYKWIK